METLTLNKAGGTSRTYTAVSRLRAMTEIGDCYAATSPTGRMVTLIAIGDFCTVYSRSGRQVFSGAIVKGELP